MKESYARHGDVHLILTGELPAGCVEEKGETAVEWGEVTGHAHRIDGPGAVILKAPSGTRYLRVVEPTNLKHEEHHTRTVPPGIWEIRRTRETDHMSGVTRQVAD